MTDYIAQAAGALVKRCGTRDPLMIARRIGVCVLFRDDFVNLKGMYSVIKRSRFIFINSNLEKPMRRLVCAHELGHDALHREVASKNAVQDTLLFGIDSRQEYEAKLFAAHLLIDESEVLSLAKQGFTSQYIAAQLKIDVNMISIIADHLITQGHELNPVVRKNNILR